MRPSATHAFKVEATRQDSKCESKGRKPNSDEGAATPRNDARQTRPFAMPRHSPLLTGYATHLGRRKEYIPVLIIAVFVAP